MLLVLMRMTIPLSLLNKCVQVILSSLMRIQHSSYDPLLA